MASLHRKSRRQFRTPLAGGGLSALPVLPKRRVARCPEAEPFSGRAGRPRRWGAADEAVEPIGGPVPTGRRVAACPELLAFPGRVVRSRPLHTGQFAAPVLPRRRQASSPYLHPFPGRASRPPQLHTGESPPPPAAGGLPPRRVARCPQPPAFPGTARRRALPRSGASDGPLVPRRRQRLCQELAPAAPIARRRFLLPGEAPSVPIVRGRRWSRAPYQGEGAHRLHTGRSRFFASGAVPSETPPHVCDSVDYPYTSADSIDFPVTQSDGVDWVSGAC